MEGSIGSIVLILVSVIVIIAVCVYIYYQAESTKSYVRSELSKFATLVNDAQYNEFTFDKLTEKNIRIINKKLNDIGNQLRSLNQTTTK